MNDEISEPSAHERRVADEEESRTGQEQESAAEPEPEFDEARKRWERIDAEDTDVMDEERDEPPPAAYTPRTG